MNFNLTPGEERIMKMVAEGHDSATIAKTFWIERGSLYYHLANIKTKTGLKRCEWARYVFTGRTEPLPVESFVKESA